MSSKTDHATVEMSPPNRTALADGPPQASFDDSLPVVGSKIISRSGISAASFRMSLSFKVSESVQGSPRDIYEKCGVFVRACLGPGHAMGALLWLCAATDAAMNLSVGFAAAALLLMYFGDLETPATAGQISVSLLIFALLTGVVALLSKLAVAHAGTWFTRRAKFAINKMADVAPGAEQATLMSHLAAAKHIYITSWVKSTTLLLTEVSCILVIAFYSLKLMGVAFCLFLVSLLFAVLDDYYLFKGQTKLNDLADRLSKSPLGGVKDDDDEEENSRFLHNYTTGTHTVVQLAHTMYAYISPVLFFYLATSTAAMSPKSGGIALSAALSCVIFYSLAVSAQIQQHGQTAKVIKNLFHAERLVEFDAANGGVFNYFDENPNAELPGTTSKQASKYTTTQAEKAGFFFTALFIVATVVTSFVLMGTTDLSCPMIPVTCGNVPETGANTVIEFESVFSITNGCSIADDVAAIIAKCKTAITASEAEVETTAWEPEDDFEAELDAVMDMQAESDSVGQHALNTHVRTISAKFSGGRSIKTVLQTYTKKNPAGGARRLDDMQEEGWWPEGEAFVGGTGDSAPNFPGQYEITVTTGDSRFNGSFDLITIQLVGEDGSTSDIMQLGEFRMRGAISTVWVDSTVDVGVVAKVKLFSNGKDGVKLSKIVVDGKYEGGMSSYLKCRSGTGSSRNPFTNCEYAGGVSMSVVGSDANACMAECDPNSQPDPVLLSQIAPNFFNAHATFPDEEKLTYSFGSVWNSCVTNGPSKFTYTAKCDTGCGDRHGSFKLSPETFWDADSDGGCQQKNGNAYPSYCINDGDAAPRKMERSSDECGGDKIGHDRGHQIPANNFDDDEDTIKQTNYMTNILPQSALMNRGAWLKTEMMVECWRNEAPITVFGGAIYMGDGAHGQSIPEEWGGFDRSDWFVESHNVKNPAYFWKVLVTSAVEGKAGFEDEDYIAFWMPNHESAKSANVNDYLITIDNLNANLNRFLVPENIVLPNANNRYSSVWEDPAGCNRA